MTDLHTHILPGMDDGARDVDTSLAMLRMEAEQGVGAVILTPHFYRDREDIPHFLRRRTKAARTLAAAITALPEDERRALPQLALGAEIAWRPNLAEWDELPRLCLGEGKHFLLELPFEPWTDQMIRQLYELPGRTGLTPVIAHIERYLDHQRSQHIEAVLALGVPVQVSAAPLLHALRRGPVLRLLWGGAPSCSPPTRTAPIPARRTSARRWRSCAAGSGTEKRIPLLHGATRFSLVNRKRYRVFRII